MFLSAALALHGDSRPWRAVLVGGLVATLPDLDVLFSTGSPIITSILYATVGAVVVLLIVSLIRRAA